MPKVQQVIKIAIAEANYRNRIFTSANLRKMQMQLDTETEDFHCKLDKEITDITLLLEDKLFTVKPQYNIHYNLKTWADAHASCKNLNSSLVKLETIENGSLWLNLLNLIVLPGIHFGHLESTKYKTAEFGAALKRRLVQNFGHLMNHQGMVTVHICM